MPKLVYLNSLPAPIAHDILAERPDIELVRITSEMTPAEAFAALSNAHAYQHTPSGAMSRSLLKLSERRNG